MTTQVRLRTMPRVIPDLSGAELLVRYLEQEGVDHVFAVPGAPLNALFQALHRSRIRTVLAKHEAGAAFMAYGYARATGRIGVCAGTAGPGTTNLVTGAAAAFWDGIPLLVLTGQVPTRYFGMGALQESTQGTVNSVTLMAQVTKYSDMVSSAALMGRMVRKALRVAFTGRRGPVALNLPADALAGPAKEDSVEVDQFRVANRSFDRLQLTRMGKRILDAVHPVILAGSGAVSSRASAELLALAQEYDIPVATTQAGKGLIPEVHPLSLGIYGFAGTPRAQEYLSRHADLILVVGSSLGQLQTGNYASPLSDRPLLQIDVDGELIGRNFPVEMGLVADAQVALKELRFQLRRSSSSRHDAGRERRRATVEALRARMPFSLREELMTSEQVPLLPPRVIHELQEALPEKSTIFWDSGSHAIWGLHYFRASDPRQFEFSSGFAAMGHSVGAVIGAGLGDPRRVPVCVTGDGCFLMHGMEVATAVNHGVPALWIVLNNGGMRMVEQGQRQLFGEAYLWQFKPLDFAALGRSLGADGHRAEKPGDVSRIIKECLAARRPAVIDCVVDPDAEPPAFTNANT